MEGTKVFEWDRERMGGNKVDIANIDNFLRNFVFKGNNEMG